MIKILKRVVLALVLILITIVTVFVLWAVLPYSTMDEAKAAMVSNNMIEVIDSRDISFKADDLAEAPVSKGLIIYPGTRVNSEAYAPLARQIAAAGYLVVIAQMPLDLSVLSISRADKIISTHSEIKNWTISGHSMGGAMAGFYTKNNPDVIDGLIMLGAYPAESTDFSDSDIKVLSLYGSNDLVASQEEVLSKKKLFPSDADYIEIPGGNHSGFAYYGEQKGDGPRTISHDEQTFFVADHIIHFMEQL